MQALRRRGVDAKLVVFNRYTLHSEADWSLERRGGFVRKQATQWSALARLLPRTDLFHFYFGLTLVPQSVQFPILGALRKKSVMHYLGSDIRGKSREELAFGKKAGAEVVGSYDAIRWVPDAEMIPPGSTSRRSSPRHRPSARVRSSSTRRRRGGARERRRSSPRALGSTPIWSSWRGSTTTRRSSATARPTS